MTIVKSVPYSSVEEHTAAMKAKLTGIFANLVKKGKEIEVPAPYEEVN